MANEIKGILGTAYQDKRFKAAIAAVITNVVNYALSIVAVNFGIPPDLAMSTSENISYAITTLVGVYITGQTLSDIRESQTPAKPEEKPTEPPKDSGTGV